MRHMRYSRVWDFLAISSKIKDPRGQWSKSLKISLFRRKQFISGQIWNLIFDISYGSFHYICSSGFLCLLVSAVACLYASTGWIWGEISVKVSELWLNLQPRSAGVVFLMRAIQTATASLSICPALLFIIICRLFPFVLRSNKESLSCCLIKMYDVQPNHTSSQSVTKVLSPFLYAAFFSPVSSVAMLHHPFHPNSQKGCARTSFTLWLPSMLNMCVLCYSLQFCIQRFCRLCLQHGRHPDGLQRTVCAQGRAQLPVGGFPGPNPLPTTGNCESHALMSCLGTVTRFITSLNRVKVCVLHSLY